MVDYSYIGGLKGLKQINKAMITNGVGVFEKYSEMFLDRMGYVDWYEKEE